MRVLHFLDSLNRGGAETLALDVSRNAKRNGIDLVIVASGGGALEDDFKQADIEFIRLDRRFPVDLRVARQLRKIIKHREIDIVQTYQAVEGIHAYLATLGLGNTKTVLGFHGFVPDRKNRLSLRFLIPRTDANIVVSKGLQNWLADVDGLATENFEVLYNGTDLERLRPSGRSVRHELLIPQDAFVIGMVGNFYSDPRKDQMTIVKAMPAVLEEFPDTYCLFAGKVEPGAESKFDECRHFCKDKNIADRVLFLGPRNDVPDLLSALDVFVLSSLQEGLPIALIEAMLAKVPMVVSDIEPHLEASENGRYARVFKTQDESDLADKLKNLRRSKVERNELASRAFDHAMANFSIDAHILALRKLYERLLNA